MHRPGLLLVAVLVLCAVSIGDAAERKHHAEGRASARLHFSPSCTKAVRRFKDLERAHVAKKDGRKTLMTCGHVAWRVYRLLTNSANNPEMAGPGKLTALLEPGQAHVGPNLRNALGKCAANSDNTLCVCATGEQCNTKMLLQAKKLYTVLIRTQTPPGQPLQASHYAILYVNSDASRVYVYQAFQNIASLEVTGWWTPADLLKAFTLMVTPAKKAPVGQVVLTEDDMDVLRAFKSDDQPYVNAIVSVAIAGPLPMPEDRCQQLVDMSETDFRLQGCQAMQYVQWGAEGCEGAPN